MTPLEMLQEFQVHYDKVDSDSLPKMYPEEILLFLNDAQLDLCREARKGFEGSTQMSEDLASLVVDGVINGLPTAPLTETIFPLTTIKQVGYEGPDDPFLPHLYTLKTSCLGSLDGQNGKVALKEVTHNEWEAVLSNPHTSPRPSLCPFRFTAQGIVVGHPRTLALPKLYLSLIQYPDPIALPNPNTGAPGIACSLPPQVHRLVVFKAVELAQLSIQRGTQLTQGQA